MFIAAAVFIALGVYVAATQTLRVNIGNGQQMPVFLKQRTANVIAAVCIVIGVLFAAGGAFAQSADAIQKRLESEATKLQTWTSDKTIVNAVVAQNAQHLTMAEIERRDKEWIAGHADALVKQSLTGPCADRVRQLASSSPAYGESFVMDDQGAIVCANVKTSDYWQGDEAKWQKSFNGGKGATFIDRPRMDDSAKEHLAQVSLPIRDASGKVIGALTVGIKLN